MCVRVVLKKKLTNFLVSKLLDRFYGAFCSFVCCCCAVVYWAENGQVQSGSKNTPSESLNLNFITPLSHHYDIIKIGEGEGGGGGEVILKH